MIRQGKESMVYGLDIGTRSVVGTVGYLDKGQFYVVAQAVREHETRAMLDGQIHDIGAVAQTIKDVTAELESKTSRQLKEVCIAAAGRVLRTENASAEIEFDDDTVITADHIYELNSAGVKKAYEIFKEHTESGDRFYCVGHSAVRYYMNDQVISNLENHKARKIAMDLIATFLPNDVVDGLYSAVRLAGLEVANLTLEPIAAIEVAIPEKFRMLNIALVDVGAGTSDICITADGTIAAYGMIPVAGDSLTDEISQQCLVEFAQAEKIKCGIESSDSVEYEDVMGLTQTISKEEVLGFLHDKIEDMTTKVSDRITELNGDKPVSAIFVVGGGGKIEGYTTLLAEKMGIPVQRVALRGEDVMQKITFMDETCKKDSLLVTPIGICLNFYEQNNNFIYITLNDERIKLYDNGKLTVVDALMQSGIANENLFPKRGEDLVFTFNGEEKHIKGELGETAIISLNNDNADLHTFIHSNDSIVLTPSTAGAKSSIKLGDLIKNNDKLNIDVNGKNVVLPRFSTVNGKIEPDNSYRINEGDDIVNVDYYTVEQVLEFLDLPNDNTFEIKVNKDLATAETKVYDRFKLEYKAVGAMAESYTDLAEATPEDLAKIEENKLKEKEEKEKEEQLSEGNVSEIKDDSFAGEAEDEVKGDNESNSKESEAEDKEENLPIIDLAVIVNKSPVVLKGKSSYVFVDVFDYINFDLSNPQGSGIVTDLNGHQAQFLEELKEGDKLDIYWKD